MVRAFMDPDSCEAIETSDLPYSDCYHYSAGDTLNLSVNILGCPVWVNLSGGRSGNKKLFQRGLVKEVLAEEDRIRVEYPSGSTYKVRPSLLEGILSEDLSTAAFHGYNVLVYRETDSYRRACVIHCGPEEDFCEIGCAEGIACEKIRQTGSPNRVPIGIDKSATCIDEAKRRHSGCKFLKADIFEEDFEWKVLSPKIVAIDINGTRQLEAVLSSVELVLRHWKPRLVLVKSRALYHAVNQRKDNPVHDSRIS